MQLLGAFLLITMVAGTLSSPVSHILDDPEAAAAAAAAAGLPFEMSPGDQDMLAPGPGSPDGRNERDLYVTPLLLWKLLQLSRAHQEPASPPKRNHYKQCAFNAVSCFG